MNYSNPVGSKTRTGRVWKRASIAALASTVLLGGHLAQASAIANALQFGQKPNQRISQNLSQNQIGWQPILNVARVPSRNQLALQLDLLDKPATSYANVAYFVYARRDDQWVQVLTNTGARLIANQSGRVTLNPEIFPLDELQRRLGGVDLSQVELKMVALLRYDLQGGQRLQTIQFERVQRYSEIVQAATTQLVTYTSGTQTEAAQETVIVTNPGSPFGSRPATLISTRREQSRFSLAIVQKKQKKKELSQVIARVSLKPRNSGRFLAEQFIGDFRYSLKKKHQAKFIRGLYVGDRVVVRLFTTDNRLIGYSEFELLSSSNTVTLVLPDRPSEYGIVRTIYGVDRDDDLEIDRSARIYDYYTQVTQVQSFRESRVTFLRSAQSLILDWFDLPGLPTPRPDCIYPTSFVSGTFALVNQVIQVFNTNLPPALVAPPGQLVRLINVSTTNISIYQVNQLIVNSSTVGVTQGTVVDRDDDDDDDDDRDRRKKPRKRNCNQGIGNGAEGCDPGNSRPRGGSNDEDDD